MATNLTSKGQVTIPKAVRDHLGIGPGSSVEFRRVADGSIVIEKASSASQRSGLVSLRGLGGRDMSTDEIMSLLRGD